MAAYNEQALRKRVENYVHKTRVLRQIQSEKLSKSRRWNNILNYSTVIVSAMVTFLGFFGVKNIHTLFLADYIGLERLDFLFNFLVLLLLIASFLQMTLGLGEKSLEHLASIRELTNFLTTLNDLELIDSPTPDFCDRTIERLNDQYKVINSTLPSNSDAEWKKAKKLLGQKEGST